MGVNVNIDLVEKVNNEYIDFPIMAYKADLNLHLNWGQSLLHEEVNDYIDEEWFTSKIDDTYYIPLNTFINTASKYVARGVDVKKYNTIMQHGMYGYEHSKYDTIDMPQYVNYLSNKGVQRMFTDPEDGTHHYEEVVDYMYAYIPKYFTLNSVVKTLVNMEVDYIKRDLYVAIRVDW